MIRFDAYSATSREAKLADLLPLMKNLAPDGELKQSKGFHRFGERVALLNEGHEIAAISWGGHQGELVMYEIKGEATPSAVDALRAAIPSHRVTRVDSCADFDAPMIFDGLLGSCLAVKRDFKLKGSKAGDWEDFPEDGRTLYLGAVTSPVRVRLYEKGKQSEYAHLNRPDWCRIEAQVRPKQQAREQYANPSITAAAVWGASPYTRALAADVLKAYIDPHPVGTTYRLSSRDRALKWMCKQYGSHLLDLLNESGSWEAVGLTLNDFITEGKSNG